MDLSLSRYDLKGYVKLQLGTFFPDRYVFRGDDVDKSFELALERLEYCYKFIAVSAYNNGQQTFFSHLHGDQYSQFLYYLANSLWKINENKLLCDKLVQLNRMLSGMFWSYKAGLPDIFYWSHPVGTVLGNAKYGNFFSCRQNCTVATQEGIEKRGFGEGLYLGAGAQILASDIEIGDRVAIAGGTTIFSEKVIEHDTLVVNRGKHVEQIQRSRALYNIRNRCFNVEI